MVLQSGVVSAAREYKIASNQLVESFNEPSKQGASGYAVSPFAEKSRKAQSLRKALHRLHQFGTRGAVPADLHTSTSSREDAVKKLN